MIERGATVSQFENRLGLSKEQIDAHVKKLGQYKDFISHAEKIKALQNSKKEAEPDKREEIKIEIENMREKLQKRMEFWKGQ